MFGSSRKKALPAETRPAAADEQAPSRLRDAMREARIEAAERTAVVVDLHDAESARLELLNEALDEVFADVPAQIELFDRGVSRGETPRLWIDAVAHVVMGRDKRIYRFVQDTRYGRKVLAESPDTAPIVQAVTRYVARRLIERERALETNHAPAAPAPSLAPMRPSAGRPVRAFIFGLLAGVAAVFAAVWWLAAR